MAENENRQPAGSKRMEILQRSLEKKQAAFDQRLQNHLDDVRGANGQPLNDKRNGQTTLNRWERQNDGLRTAQKEIEKTQRAIEREQAAIDRVNNADIPEFLKPMIESGEITQWRKFPNRFFVSGVEKARIIWDKDKQQFGYAYLQGVTGEQFAKFRDTYNHILALHRQEQERKNTPESEKPAQQAEERSSENVSDDPKAQPAETYALFGKKAGEQFETFIADKVRFDDGGISPIDSRELAEHVKSLSEKDGYTDVRIVPVRLHEKPDFVQTIQGKPSKPEAAVQAADKATSSEKHYSENIIDRLTEHHGWTKQDGMAAEKTYMGAQKGSSLNPDGRLTVYARFDETGRYLSLESGSGTVFDIDARDTRPETAAAVFNLFAERVASKIPFTANDVTEMLENAKSKNWIEDRLEESGYAYVSATPGYWEKSVGHHDIKVSFIENEAYVTQTERQGGNSESFKIPVRESDTVMDVVGQREQAARENSPAPEVALLPEKTERPSEKEARQPAQTLDERLQAVKERYGQRLSDMNADGQKKHRILEAGMENLIKGLPEQTQMQARLNFYQTQYERMGAKTEPEQSPEQQELFYGR